MRAVLPGSRRDGPRPRLGEVPDPVPSAGEVRLDVRATALNRADLLQLRGLYPPPPGVTEVPGLECSGVVAECGPGVEDWRPGDRVMALLAGGGHAEKAVVPAGQLMPLPDSLSFVEGAALPEAALTSWTNLVAEGVLEEGETVLVTGATSGVGTVAVQLARRLGARVLAAGRSAERLDRLRELGADAGLVLGDGLPAAVRAANRGQGVDLVIDLVSGVHLDSFLACLAARGRLVLVGLMAGARAEIDLASVLRRRLRIVGSVLRARSVEEKRDLVAAFWRRAGRWVEAGELRPVIDRTFPFERIADAYRAMEEGGHLGKLVIEVEAIG